MRRSRLFLVAIVGLLSLLSTRLSAAPNLADITGNLVELWGQAASNATVTFQSNGGNFQGTILPPTYFSVLTDSSGNLPTGSVPCSNILQTGCNVELPWSARVNVSYQSANSNQSGGPFGIQICDATTCDLGTLIILAHDPPSVVTGVLVNPGGDYGLSSANPPAGAFGTTLLQPGKVTGIQGYPVCNTPPVLGDVLTGTGTGSCWEVIPSQFAGNLCKNGMACDWQQDQNVTIAANSNALSTSTSPGPFKSTDCNVSHGGGCTGTADKLIRIADLDNQTNNGSADQFSGTIVGFTDAQHVTISSNYPAHTNTGPTQAMWATDDSANWAALMALTCGATSPYDNPNIPTRFDCTKPIMTSNTLVVNQCSIDLGGAGWSSLLDNNAGCAVIWAPSSQKSVPVIDVQNNLNSRIHDLVIPGNDVYPPIAGVQTEELTDASEVLINKNNSFYNILVGDLAVYNLGPGWSAGDTSGTMSGDHAAGDTSITLSAAPTGLLPGAEVRFLDPNGNGPEVGFTTNNAECTSGPAASCTALGQPWQCCTAAGVGATCQSPWPCCTGIGTGTCYAASANPILLQDALQVAHTAANTTVVWNRPSVTRAFALGPSGTADDTNMFDNIVALNTDIPFFDFRNTGVSQGVTENVGTMTVFNYGLMVAAPNNGQIHFHNINAGAPHTSGGDSSSAGIHFYCGGAASFLVDQMASETDGCNVAGSNYLIVNGTANQGGGTGLCTFQGSNIQIPLTNCLAHGNITLPNGKTDADIIDNVADQNSPMTVKIQNLGYVQTNTAAASLPNNQDPTIRVRTGVAGGGGHTIAINASSSNDHVHVIQYTDNGSDNVAFKRVLNIIESPNLPQQGYRILNNILYGQDQPHWNTTSIWSGLEVGDFSINPGITPPAPSNLTLGAATGQCASATGSGTDHYYLEVGVEGDGLGMSGLSGIAGPIQGPSTLSATNCVTGQLGQGAPYEHYLLFHASVAHNAAIPAVSAFRNVVGSNLFGDFGQSSPTGLSLTQPSLVDVGTYGAIAPPTTAPSTGTANFNGPTSVAAAPIVIGNVLSSARGPGSSTVANAPTFEYLIENFTAQVPGAPAWGELWDMGQASGNGTGLINSNTATVTNPGSVLTFHTASLVVDSSNLSITFPGDAAAGFTVASSATLPSGDTLTVCIPFQRGHSGSAFNETLWGQKSGGLALLFPNGTDQLVARQEPLTNMYGSDAAILDTNPHLVCYVKNGTVNHMYLGDYNSFADATANIGGNQTLAPADATEYIGWDYTGSAGDEFDGIIDDTFVSTSALTFNQLNQIWGFWKSAKFGSSWWATNGCANNPLSAGCTNNTGAWGILTSGGLYGQPSLPQYLTASLPTCSTTVNYHAWAVITDQNVACASTGYGVAPGAGSGIKHCPIWCDGTAWLLH